MYSGPTWSETGSSASVGRSIPQHLAIRWESRKPSRLPVPRPRHTRTAHAACCQPRLVAKLEARPTLAVGLPTALRLKQGTMDAWKPIKPADYDEATP
jgi:hypothetical protein